MRRRLAAGAALIAMATGVGPAQAEAVANPAVWPKAASPAALSDARTEAFVRDLLSRMSVEEKVGQVVQADISYIKPEDLKAYPLGSILAGGSSGPFGDERGSAQKWLDMVRAYRAAAAERPGTKVPLMFGIDAVHGHNNLVGATLFPHNIGLGAARDPDLIRRIGEATAAEVAATGADWTFAPTLAVPRDDRWGRTYEGYAENPEIARAYAGAMTLGLQGTLVAGRSLAPGKVAGSAKHFLADGGTDAGLDQGDAKISERALIDLHLSGYPQAIDAGVLTIMASFSSWNGVKHTGNRSLLTDVLRGPLGFTGFVVGDWNAHGQVPGCTKESCAPAFNAGLDMFMAPDSWKGLYANSLAQVRSGEIPMARLDEAVTRILRVKVKAGLFEASRPGEGRFEVIASDEHRALAREAVRKSLVLLKNNRSVLPIRPGAKVLVAGASADDIGQASGGWTITWQGTAVTNADFPGGQSIWAGLKEAVEAVGGRATLSADASFTERPDVAVVVFGEAPYAEFQGDVDNLDFSPEEPLAQLRKLKAAGIPTVAVFLSGRPLWTNPEINAADAFVAAWLPGSQGAGVADVLVADREGRARHDFQGRLSFSWPKTAVQGPLNMGDADYDPQFAYGYGLTYAAAKDVGPLPEESGVSVEGGTRFRYFADGRFVAPWGLTLRDAKGSLRVGQLRTAASPGGGVAVDVADGRAQESARVLRFAGGQEASAAIGGRASDFTGAQGMALQLRYRIDSPASAQVALSFGGRPLDVSSAFRAGATGQWRSLTLPLSCFGADLKSVSEPLRIATAGALVLAIEEIRLIPATAAACPA